MLQVFQCEHTDVGERTSGLLQPGGRFGQAGNLPQTQCLPGDRLLQGLHEKRLDWSLGQGEFAIVIGVKERKEYSGYRTPRKIIKRAKN